MTEQQAIVKSNGHMVSAFGTREDVKALDDRLKVMLPGAEKLDTGQRMALAQAAIAHGLDPFNGELWMIQGRGLMVGIKGLRKKAHQQVKGNFWIDFRLITTDEERAALRIPNGALAYEARLFDTENITTYTATVEKMLKAGIPWEAVKDMVGSKPYTSGIGMLKAGDQTKMDPVQCAMKRAEADAIKRRFDVPFGMNVADDDEPDYPGFVVPEPDKKPVETVEAEYVPTPESLAKTEADLQARRKRDNEALYGSEN